MLVCGPPIVIRDKWSAVGSRGESIVKCVEVESGDPMSEGSVTLLVNFLTKPFIVTKAEWFMN